MNKEKIARLEIIFETSYENTGSLPLFIESCRDQAISLIKVNLMSKEEAKEALDLLKNVVVEYERESIETARQAKQMIVQVQLVQREVLYER